MSLKLRPGMSQTDHIMMLMKQDMGKAFENLGDMLWNTSCREPDFPVEMKAYLVQ